MANEQKHKWTKNDTILAFELYCVIPQKEVKPNHPLIVNTAMAIGTTPESLHARLQNFKTYDPSYTSGGRKGLTHGSKLDAEIVAEFLNNSSQLLFEAERIKAELGIRHETETQPEIIDIPQGYTREQTIQARFGQSFFRKTLLASYNNQCCITGLPILKLLRASHIKPWRNSSESEKTNPQNGLLLNALFDAAFDEGYISLDCNFKVIASSKISDSSDKFVQKTILPYVGMKIVLPQRFLPDKTFIQYHNDVIFQG